MQKLNALMYLRILYIFAALFGAVGSLRQGQ